MVVILLVGLISALVRLSGIGRNNLDSEMERLRLAVERSADRAKTRGMPIRFEPLPQGYRFSHLDVGGNWLPVFDEPLLREHRLPNEVVWRRISVEEMDTAAGLVFGSDTVLFSVEIGLSSGAIALEGLPSGRVRKKTLEESARK